MAQVAESVDVLGGTLYGVGCVSFAGEQQGVETVGVPCRHFRLRAARNGGEEHRCGFAFGGAECNAEAAVFRGGQRIEGKFCGMGHDATAYAVGGDEGRGHRTAESQRGIAAVGKAAFLPDHRLPQFRDTRRVGRFVAGEAYRVVTAGLGTQCAGEHRVTRCGVDA